MQTKSATEPIDTSMHMVEELADRRGLCIHIRVGIVALHHQLKPLSGIADNKKMESIAETCSAVQLLWRRRLTE